MCAPTTHSNPEFPLHNLTSPPRTQTVFLNSLPYRQPSLYPPPLLLLSHMSYSNWKRKAEMSDFLCDFRFQKNLRDPSAKCVVLPCKRDIDGYCKYSISSLEKKWKPELHVEPDMVMPMDLNTLKPPEGERIPLDPENEELLLDDDCPPNAVAADDMKWEGSPSDKDFPCLVKSPDLSPLKAEKQAKCLPEYQVPNSSTYLDKRERDIQVFLDSFEACKSLPRRIAYGVNFELKPRRVQPLFPCFDWANDQSVVLKLSTVPNAGPEMHESRCVQFKPGALGRTYCIGSSSKPPLNEVEARSAGAISSRIGSQMPAHGIMQETLAQDTAVADDDNMSG